MKYTTPKYKLNYELYNKILNGKHVLIAGSTGAGKSVLINNLLEYIITNETPADTQLILCDPKKTELIDYKNLPFTLSYNDENETILNALDNVIKIMMLRYDDMQKRHLKNYDGNRIYIIIDELMDLMTTCAREIVPKIQRIALLGRAGKITLVCATQAPNRKVIPANLTVNFNCRVALHCNSAIESRQILNVSGAELLPDYGYCLLSENGGNTSKYKIPLTDNERLNNIINHWAIQNKCKRPKRATKNIDVDGICDFLHDTKKAFKNMIKIALILLIMYAFYATK